MTRRPRSTSSRPSDAAAMPLPSDETTPPVTKMYFVGVLASRLLASGRHPWCVFVHSTLARARSSSVSMPARRRTRRRVPRPSPARRPAAAAARAVRRARAGAAAAPPSAPAHRECTRRRRGAARSAVARAARHRCGVAKERNGRTRKVQGPPVVGRDDLHDIRILEDLEARLRRRRAERESARLPPCPPRRARRLRGHERLVALHVDDRRRRRRIPAARATSATRSVPDRWSGAVITTSPPCR